MTHANFLDRLVSYPIRLDTIGFQVDREFKFCMLVIRCFLFFFSCRGRGTRSRGRGRWAVVFVTALTARSRQRLICV